MKKIAIISINGFGSAGGVERVVELHKNILTKHGFLVRVFSISSLGAVGAWVEKSDLAKKFALAFFPLVSPFLARWWAGGTGLVMTHGFSSIGIFSDITFAHGCWGAFCESLGLKKTLYSRLMYLYEKSAARFSKRVYAVSEAVAKDWILFYGATASKMSVLHNSIDLEKFNSERKLNCSEKSPKIINILFVGRLERAKGLDFLKKLCCELRLLPEKRFELNICTPSSLNEADKLDLHEAKIYFHQNQDEMAAHYSGADMLVLPSMYEAFELVTIESLACGTPVLLNDTGSRKTLIELGCPGLYELKKYESPLESVSNAFNLFKNLDRNELSNWTKKHFDAEVYRKKIIDLADSRSASGLKGSRGS